ncbi:MAG: hypothetical protein ABH851_03005 [Methanobacteriota archaeon]
MTKANSGTPFDLIVPIDDLGAAFNLDQKVIFDSEVTTGKKIIVNTPLHLKSFVRKVAKNTLNYFNLRCGARINIVDSKLLGLPGELESSCIVAVASLLGDIARKNGSINELRVDKHLREQFFLVSDRVLGKNLVLKLSNIPGLSFAKLCACFYGGFSVSRDTNLLRSGEMEEFKVKIVKTPINKKNGFKTFLSNERELLWNEVYRGNFYSAMNLSALISSSSKNRENIIKEISKGSIACSIEDGFTCFLYRKNLKPQNRNNTNLLSILNEGVNVLEKSRRIYKLKDFLKLDGASEFGILS